MLKVSFKDNYKKSDVFNNKVTEVTLTGSMEMPEWWHHIPKDIADWVWDHPSVEFDGYFATNKGIITAKGKSKCREGEKFDAAVGERIAEARAKIRIYRFMYTLCAKLMSHYFKFLYGNRTIYLNSESHDEAPKDCVRGAYKKYKNLLSREYFHLAKLLEEA